MLNISLRAKGVALAMVALLGLVCSTEQARAAVLSQSSSALSSQTDISGWKLFVSRAGWQIKYPRHWQMGSCGSCSDPTDPNVFVSFYDPAAKGEVMIEPLGPKPATESTGEWFDEELKTKAIFTPIVSQQPLTLDGKPALTVRFRAPSPTGGRVIHEAVYVVYGTKTLMILGPDIENKPLYQSYLTMLSTLHFTK